MCTLTGKNVKQKIIISCLRTVWTRKNKMDGFSYYLHGPLNFEFYQFAQDICHEEISIRFFLCLYFSNQLAGRRQVIWHKILSCWRGEKTNKRWQTHTTLFWLWIDLFLIHEIGCLTTKIKSSDTKAKNRQQPFCTECV